VGSGDSRRKGTGVRRGRASSLNTRTHHRDRPRLSSALIRARATTPRWRLRPNSTEEAADCGSAISVGIDRMTSRRDADSYWGPTHVTSRQPPNTIKANRTGQQIRTEYLAPLMSIAWTLPFSPSVSSSLAVGLSTQVAECTRVRALSTRPDAMAKGVTHAVPRKAVMT